MRKVWLHGSLNRFGDSVDLDVNTAGEAIVALSANFPDIIGDLRVGSWAVMRGDRETGIALDEEAIAGLALGSADLHIMPHIAGAKNSNGAIKAIVGIALVAVSFGGAAFLGAPISASLLGATTWGNAMGQLGLALTLSGISTMLAPEESSGSDDEQSFTISGPVSRYGQGHALQLVYGEVITGAMMISGGMDAQGLEETVEAPVVEQVPSVVISDPENTPDGSGL